MNIIYESNNNVTNDYNVSWWTYSPNLNRFITHSYTDYNFKSGILFCNISDEEYNILKTFKFNPDLRIKDGDKIFFDKKTNFPKTFIKNIPTIKRTIKKDLADIVVIPNQEYNGLLTIDKIKPVFLCTTCNYGVRQQYISIEDLEKYNLTEDDFKNSFEHVVKTEKCYILPKQYANYNTILTKVLPLSNLITYCNSKLPTLPDKNTFFGMLSSTDSNQINLAINMFKMYNMSDVLFDLYLKFIGRSDLIETIPKKFFSRIDLKYILSILNIKRRGLRSGYNIFKTVGLLLNNNLITDDQKLRARVFLQKTMRLDLNDPVTNSYYLTQFQMNNIPLEINDPNGKAESIYREMEEEWW